MDCADTSRKRNCRVAFNSFDAGSRNCAGRCGNGACFKELFFLGFATIGYRTTTRLGICVNGDAASDQHAVTYLSCGS